MDEDKASRFISSLVKSIQALCNGFVDFSTSIEVVGHIHLNIDRNVKLDYVLTEEVSKSVSEGSTVFSSHSYHSQAPPSVAPKGASDSSNSSHKTRKDNDPLGLSALAREVPNSSKSDSHSHSLNRVSESSNSSHSGNVGFSRTSDIDTLKQENNRTSCQLDDSANRRRKMGQLSQTTPSPAAKRVRTNDYSLGSKTVIKEQGFEVIEIKEEPDDEPTVFFGSSGPGQDIQTPDFTNVVMESLDRVNQLEGSELGDGGGGDAMGGPQQPVFPVMFHQSDGMSSSGGPVPGPSSDPQSVASTSGASFDTYGGYPENPELRGDLQDPATFTLTQANGSQHFLERGEGLNHRCAVCERKHSTFQKQNLPGTLNPFKRKKTRYRCAACKVYLCTSVRECWWIWHQENMDSSTVYPS
ncbi:hypothetical protein ACOMHN_007474 [Nucella lapillus]